MTHLADLTSQPVRGRSVFGQDEWLNRSKCPATLHNHHRRFTCVSSKNNCCSPATLHFQQRCTSSNAALPATLHFQQRCTSSNAALPATLHFQQRCTSSNAALPATLHFQQRCTSSNAALPATLHFQQRCTSSNAEQWIQTPATPFQDWLSLGRTVIRRKHYPPSSMLLRITSLKEN